MGTADDPLGEFEDPFAPKKDWPVAPSRSLSDQANKIYQQQEPFLRLAGQFHELFWALPTATPREVDARLAPMWEALMDAAATAGLSRNAIPQLKECCGKKRAWPDQAKEPRYLMVGDWVRAIAKLVGFRKPCAACEERRAKLNRLIRIGRK